ncbi:MAG: ABC transporter substrate-binding protein [Anaerolineae bacterium]|nr:ABC transporter substrate-binding protein [Anaerolineae bacterium]
MKRFLGLTLLLILLTPAGVYAQESTHVTLFVPYIPNVQFAPLYVALENGYFAEENIDVEIEYSFNEADGIDRIAIDDLQFGVLSGEQVIVARGAGKPLVYVLEWYHDFPVGVVAPADSGITVPEDLIGKKVGIPGPYGASYMGFRALLGANEIDELELQVESIGFTAPEAVCTGQVDAAVVYVNNEPLTIQENCFDTHVIYVSDYVDLVSNGLVTNEKTIEDNPELVAGMAKAIQRGIEATIDHPDAAFDISIGFIPDLAEADYETQLQVLKNTVELWQSENLGVTEPARWETTQQVMLDIGFISEPLSPLEAAYTLQFLQTGGSSQHDELTPITFFVSYIPSVQFSPIYAAIENGYFAEEGIEVEVEHSFNEADGIDRIAVNDLQFGMISGEQVIVARAAGKPLVYVMEWFHNFPVGIVVPADSGIDEPADLIGKKVGIPGPFGASYMGFRALLANADINELELQVESIGFTAPEAICTGQVEASIVYVSNEPLTIQKNCFEVNIIYISDYVNLVSNGLVTNEETIQNEPALVAGVTRALQRGVQFVMENPDEAFQLSLKYIPDLPESEYETQKQVLLNSVELWKSDELGATDPARWITTQEVMLDIGFMDAPLENLEAAYTLEFLPQNNEQ